jgi:hypothetical protein
MAKRDTSQNYAYAISAVDRMGIVSRRGRWRHGKYLRGEATWAPNKQSGHTASTASKSSDRSGSRSCPVPP